MFETKHSVSAQALEELRTARDEARVKLHLLSLEARQRWQDFESKLETLEERLLRGEEQAIDSALGRARELTRAGKEFFQRYAWRGPALQARVSSIMTEAVQACGPSDTLNRAAQIMWEADCGAVPVVDAERKVLGMITDRDICMACYTRGGSLGALAVSESMSRTLSSCRPEDSLEQALSTMAEKQLRRLPVVSERGELVGVVTVSDITRRVCSEDAGLPGSCAALANALNKISEQRGPAGRAPVMH